jgi:hypothetical protein
MALFYSKVGATTFQPEKNGSLSKEKGTYLDYSILSKHGLEAPHLQTHVLSELSHMSEHFPARFGLVDAKLSSQGAHPRLPIIDQAQPIFSRCTALCCSSETSISGTEQYVKGTLA